ncbi:MAG: FGGY family carbohydrate kinase [Anaerolineae bacterium]
MNDGRSGPQCDLIDAKVGEHKLYQIIGSRLLAGFTALKIVWLRENEPESCCVRSPTFCCPKDYASATR